MCGIVGIVGKGQVNQDIYDALTTDRPYRRALSLENALATMEQEVHKGWWDPRTFDKLLQMFTQAPRQAPRVMRAPTPAGSK